MLTVGVFFNDTATTEIYTLSLHDALPICTVNELIAAGKVSPPAIAGTYPLAEAPQALRRLAAGVPEDRKSTRLNSSHANISYAVFCLKKITYSASTVRLWLDALPSLSTYD